MTAQRQYRIGWSALLPLSVIAVAVDAHEGAMQVEITAMPAILVLGGLVVAKRWEAKQPDRRLALFHACRCLLAYYFAILIVQIALTVLYPEFKVFTGTIITIAGLIIAERQYARMSRWVKKARAGQRSVVVTA